MAATYPELPRLQQAIAGIPARRRPSWSNTVAVALLLADRFQDQRGYVDETVEQISEAICLSVTTVRTVLSALDQVGFWVRAAKGNQHRGTRRTPGFTTMHRGPDPAEQTVEHRGPDPTMLPTEHRGVGRAASRGSAPSIAGWTAQHRGSDPATPHTSTYTHTSSSLDDDIRKHLDRHIDHNRHLIDNEHAIRCSQYPRMRDVALEAHELGDNPLEVLEQLWPTHTDPADDYDPVTWHQEVS